MNNRSVYYCLQLIPLIKIIVSEQKTPIVKSTRNDGLLPTKAESLDIFLCKPVY